MLSNGSARRLAAILAADVVGYSRQMAADEPGTLARLRTLRAEVIDPLVTEHGGRLFKTMGDGFLVEFVSAVQALQCALAIQRRVTEHDDALPMRIGVHQGDVVAEGDDLLGDGVNVAARLEGLAEPGGICISARVREDASGRMDQEKSSSAAVQNRHIAQLSIPGIEPRTVPQSPASLVRGRIVKSDPPSPWRPQPAGCFRLTKM